MRHAGRMALMVALALTSSGMGCGSEGDSGGGVDGGGDADTGGAGNGGVPGWSCYDLQEGGGTADFGCYCTTDPSSTEKCEYYTTNCVLYSCGSAQCCDCGRDTPVDGGTPVATCPPPK